MSLIHLENENYDDLVREGVVLVDFYAEWCGPCKMLGPALEAISVEKPNIKVVKVDVDKHEALAGRFGIMSVPTLHLYKDGNMVSERRGFQPKEILVEWIASVE